MNSILNVCCSEQIKIKYVNDFVVKAFRQIENFWSGHKNAPFVRSNFVDIGAAMEKCLQENFSECQYDPTKNQNIYATAKFDLNNGNVTIEFFKYPVGGKFPEFDKPFIAYFGKYCL